MNVPDDQHTEHKERAAPGNRVGHPGHADQQGELRSLPRSGWVWEIRELLRP